MRGLLSVLVGLGIWLPSAEGAVLLELDKPVDVTGLTEELKEKVSALEGVSQIYDTLEVRRMTGEFTEEERRLIRQTLDTHNARTSEQARQQSSQPVEIPLSDFGAAAGGIAGAAALVIVARRKKGAN